MKKILVILSLFAFSQDLLAQDQRFRAGLILGTNFSQIDGDASAGYIKFGLVAGLRGVVLISDNIDLSVELLFDQRGSRSQSNFGGSFSQFNLKNNYAMIPVVVNYQLWLDDSEEFYKLHFHGGLAYGRLLNASDKEPASFFELIIPHFRKNDIAALFGLSYHINYNIAVTVRSNYSIFPLYQNGDGPVSVAQPLRPKSLSLQLLYMF